VHAVSPPLFNDPMSQVYIPFLDDPTPGEPGDLSETERWWVERQEALERAGYMLRPRFRPGWQPSWAGTDKTYFDFEDGQTIGVSHDIVSLAACSYNTRCA
jgi:hypothetical protein